MFWIRFLFCSMLSSFMDLPPSFYCSTASTFTAPSAHDPYLVSCSIRGDVLAVWGTWRCRRCPRALEGLQDSSGPWPAPGQRQQLGQQPDPWRWPPPCPRAKPPPPTSKFLKRLFSHKLRGVKCIDHGSWLQDLWALFPKVTLRKMCVLGSFSCLAYSLHRHLLSKALS